MTYKAKIGGKDYVLPPRTLAIDEQIETMRNINERYTSGELTRRDVVQMQFDFLSLCAPGAFENVETLDVNELLTAMLSVIEAYNAPAIKARNEAILSQLRPTVNSPEFHKAMLLAGVKK